jgi:hypothetical protein
MSSLSVLSFLSIYYIYWMWYTWRPIESSLSFVCVCVCAGEIVGKINHHNTKEDEPDQNSIWYPNPSFLFDVMYCNSSVFLFGLIHMECAMIVKNGWLRRVHFCIIVGFFFCNDGAIASVTIEMEVRKWQWGYHFFDVPF